MNIRFNPAQRRIREIEDPFGARVRLSVEPHPAGTVILIERPDAPHAAAFRLDVYGAEMLAAVILAARMTTPGDIPGEWVDGQFPACFDLINEPSPAIRLSRPGEEDTLDLPVPIWDRLFVELAFAATCAREAGRRGAMIH